MHTTIQHLKINIFSLPIFQDPRQRTHFQSVRAVYCGNNIYVVIVIASIIIIAQYIPITIHPEDNEIGSPSGSL